MSINFSCPVCKTAYTVNDRDAGRKSSCAKCGQRLQVPASPAVAPSRHKTILGETAPPAPPPEPRPPRLPRRKSRPRPEPESDVIPDPDPIPTMGLPRPRRRRSLTMPLLAIGGAVALLGVTACCGGLIYLGSKADKDSKPGGQPAAPAVEVVEASDLLAQYSANSVRADNYYGHKRIRVRGRITSFLGGSVLLENFPAVTVFLNDKNEIAKLNKGEVRTFEGTISLGNEGGVWLGSARLVND